MNSLVKIKITVGVALLFVSFFLAFLLSSSILVHAQAVGNSSLDGVDISFTPSNPAPGNTVTVSIQSYSTDLNRAAVTWFVNGTSFAKGNGIKSIDIQAPVPGKSTQIVASINTVEGASIQKTVTVKSGDVDLIWETSGYRPPFYLGKVPFAYQNTVKFTAVPHFTDKNGKAIDPKTLIYKWSNGSDVLGDRSGYGRQTLVMAGSIIPRPLEITVEVSSLDQGVNGQAAVTLTPDVPSVTFYQDDPLYGILYNNAIGSAFRFFHNEVKIVAAPFGFDATDKNLSYDWSVNNVSQETLSASRAIVLRVNDGQQGSSDVGLTVKNSGNNILQEATAGFTGIFNTPKASTASVAF